MTRQSRAGDSYRSATESGRPAAGPMHNASHGGHPPWRTGFSVMLHGVVLVGIAIAFGGC
jgi:hypothetical protein